ncbi:MAG: hypothetical protein V4641_30380 [Pseudomonadota bacterium]
MAKSTLTGGDSLHKKLTEIAEKMGAGAVKVGFMAGATYPDGTPVPAVAFWNEYGTTKAPPRPFFRRMIAKESGTWADKMARLAVVTNYDGARILALMGEDVGAALQQSIIELSDPPLAQSTIDAKSFDKPLIDTGTMIRAISYQVTDEEAVKIPYQGGA